MSLQPQEIETLQQTLDPGGTATPQELQEAQRLWNALVGTPEEQMTEEERECLRDGARAVRDKITALIRDASTLSRGLQVHDALANHVQRLSATYGMQKLDLAELYHIVISSGPKRPPNSLDISDGIDSIRAQIGTLLLFTYQP